MEVKYVHGIKAGLIGGAVLGIILIVNFVIAIIASSSFALNMLGLLNCCIMIGLVFLFACVGVLGVMMAKADVKTLKDALVVSAVAGAIAGLISAVVYVITQIISPWLSSSSSTTFEDIYGITGSSQLDMAAWGGLGGVCCCGPVILLAAIVLSMIGGAIYAALVLKLS